MLDVAFGLTNAQTLRGHHGSALSHITSGVKILSEVRSGAEGKATHGSLTVSANPYVRLENLEVIFNRLNTQVAQVRYLRKLDGVLEAQISTLVIKIAKSILDDRMSTNVASRAHRK